MESTKAMSSIFRRIRLAFLAILRTALVNTKQNRGSDTCQF